MNFINDISKQVRELFESMTPGARVTAALLLAVVVVSVGFLFQQSTAGPDEYLFGAEPLTGSQINAMTAAMSQARLNGFEVEGARIRVPRGERHAYIAAVADAGALPSDAKDFMTKALNNSNPFDTRETKQQRIKLALEQELSHVISWFPWVDRASVVYDVKAVRGPRAREIASATVSIMPTAGEQLDSRRERNIRKLVAGGFTSMAPENVTVNNLGGDGSIGFGDEFNPEEFETPYHRERARVENKARRDILSHLSHIPGVRVQVSAVLNEVVEQQLREEKPDAQAVAETEVTKEETTSEKITDPAGRPGQVANGPRGARADDAPARENQRETTSSETITDSRVGQLTKQEIRVGMKAEEIQASIEVPRSYVIGVWKQQQELVNGEPPEKVDVEALKFTESDIKTAVENAVKPLLPTQVAQDEYQQVNVVFIDTVPGEPLPAPSIANEALAWTGRNGSTLAMMGVAAFSLLMLRSVVRGASGGDSGPEGAPALQLTADGEVVPAGDDEDEAEEGRPRLKLKKADSLKDDLSDMVREDPDAAAAILRGWIGNAS